MRIVTYANTGLPDPRMGVRVGHRVLDVGTGSRVDGEPLPRTLRALLVEGRGAIARVHALAKAAQQNAGRFSTAMLEERAVRFLPPIPDPGRFELVRCGKEEAESIASTTLVGHDANVAMPQGVASLGCKPYLVFVMSRGGSRLDPELDPADHVAGVTFLHAFAGCAVAALGPEMVTLDEVGDPEEIWITSAVNGHERLRRPARAHLEQLPAALARLTRAAPLEPGDLVALELPEESLVDIELRGGDVVETSIGRITTLRTPIVAV